MLCSQVGTRTSRSTASSTLCPPPGKFFLPGCAKVDSTSSSQTFMRMCWCANSLAMTTQLLRRGSLFHVHRTTTSSWVDAGQLRTFLYPINAIASTFTLCVLPCPTACTHMHARGTLVSREEPRHRAVFVARGFALVATVSPFFLLSPPWATFPPGRASTMPSRCMPLSCAHK
jgi:hypothetical protein